ncbi:uncharacterized protein LOC123879576 [Maniola jurtina]|uniref:uncharacterized protein LOC123879576 n=1 Tax=Maniola jurtina TaxID=191418 RepID=UPI001E68EFD3|nr:uncharacterized protein LOC123879576 [Maniola jurtina]
MLRNQIFLLTLYFFFNVNFITANSKIFIKIHDPDELDPYVNIIDKIDNRNSRIDDIELVTKALEIIEQEKTGITAVKINKCLSTYFGSTKDKFNCIKRLVYKGKSENYDSKPYVYTNFYNKERIPYKYKQFGNNFKDLTKSGKESESKRMFQTIINFSQDYLDINDLLRSNTEFTEEPVDMKNIKSTELRIFNGISFKNAYDLKRLYDFSQDYLDPDDLLKTNARMDKEIPKEVKNSKQLYIFQLMPSKTEVNNKLGQFTNIPNKKELKVWRRFGNTVPKNDFIMEKILRRESIESDSSSSREESRSEEKKMDIKGVKGKDKKGKRFQVISDQSGQDISSDDVSNESDIPIQRPIEIPVKEKKVYYMQAPNRILKIRNEGRRRLLIFFPKRYHWDPEDMRHLQYHWFSGRQGKYGGHYKTPY